MDLLHEKETYSVIGAAMDVHSELGYGFLEAVYQEALEYEFKARKIPYERELPLKIYYKGNSLKKYYIADFICDNKFIIEVKTVSSINSDHNAQLLNYLKATGLKLGLILNFGKHNLEHKRIIN